MSGSPRPQASQAGRYYSAYRGAIATDAQGKFTNFILTPDDSHRYNGYWTFHSRSDELRAYMKGISSPEAVLCAAIRGENDHNDISLRWRPGHIEQIRKGSLIGTAQQHLYEISKIREFLGKPHYRLSNQIPRYPTDPRMNSFYEARSKISATVTSPKSPVPTTDSSVALPGAIDSELPCESSQDDGLGSLPDTGISNFADTPMSAGTPAPDSSAVARNCTSREALRTAHAGSPKVSSQFGSESDCRFKTISQQGAPSSQPTKHARKDSHTRIQQHRAAPEPALEVGGRPGIGNAQSARRRVQHQPQMVSSASTNFLQRCPEAPRLANPTTSPTRPDQQARPKASSHRNLSNSSQNDPSGCDSPVQVVAMPQMQSPGSRSAREGYEGEGRQAPVMAPINRPQTTKPNHPQPHTRLLTTPSRQAGSDHPAKAPNYRGDQNYVDVNIRTRSDISAKQHALPIATSPIGSRKHLIERDMNETSPRKRAKNEHSASATGDVPDETFPVETSARKPGFDVHSGLCCVDCGELETHSWDCHIGTLKPIQNPTILNYRNWWESTEKFDPGPWTTHEVPAEPEAETPDDAIQAMAAVIKNEQTYRADPTLQDLPNEFMIMQWALGTGPDIELIRDTP